jgi:hypothetical protein
MMQAKRLWATMTHCSGACACSDEDKIGSKLRERKPQPQGHGDRGQFSVAITHYRDRTLIDTGPVR